MDFLFERNPFSVRELFFASDRCRGGKKITMITFAFSRRGLLAYVYSGVSNKE